MDRTAVLALVIGAAAAGRADQPETVRVTKEELCKAPDLERPVTAPNMDRGPRSTGSDTRSSILMLRGPRS